MEKFTKLSFLKYSEKFRYKGEIYFRGPYIRKKGRYSCFRLKSICGKVSISFIYLLGSIPVVKL